MLGTFLDGKIWIKTPYSLIISPRALRENWKELFSCQQESSCCSSSKIVADACISSFNLMLLPSASGMLDACRPVHPQPRQSKLLHLQVSMLVLILSMTHSANIQFHLQAGVPNDCDAFKSIKGVLRWCYNAGSVSDAALTYKMLLQCNDKKRASQTLFAPVRSLHSPPACRNPPCLACNAVREQM